MFGTENRRGVSKEDAAQRNYFDILGRHFWHICGVSFWFALSNLLFFGASIYLFSSYFGGEIYHKVYPPLPNIPNLKAHGRPLPI